MKSATLDAALVFGFRGLHAHISSVKAGVQNLSRIVRVIRPSDCEIPPASFSDELAAGRYARGLYVRLAGEGPDAVVIEMVDADGTIFTVDAAHYAAHQYLFEDDP